MLSSRWTYFVKYILGPFWVLSFGALAFSFAFAPSAWEGGRGGPPPPELRWLFPVIWVVATVGILRFTFPIKRVEMRERRLFVSNSFASGRSSRATSNPSRRIGG